MTKNEILKKIGIIIIELREQYDLTQLNRDDINDIELELFAANSHFLTDHIEILRKLNNRDIKPLREGATPEPKFFETLVKTTLPEMEQPQLNFPKENEIDDPEIEQPIHAEAKPVIIRHELVLDEPTQIATDDDEDIADDWATQEKMEVELEAEPKEEKQSEEEIIEEPVADIELEPEIVPDREVIKTEIIFEDADDKPLVTINQILSSQVSSAHHPALQPITDLKSAINLNDKLLFVRDLFNGYSMAYGEAIDILNRFSRFEEADSFLKLNYYAKNTWEAKQATTDKFYELLQRRFPE